jgi:hypothetical protein
MPLEVIDRKGETVGIIVGRYGSFDKGYYYLVACNREKCNLEELLPTEKLEQAAANHLGTKKILGQVQRDKLYEKLEEWWRSEQEQEPAAYEPRLALRTLAFAQYAFGPFKLMEKVAADYYFLCRGAGMVGGKVLLDIEAGELDLPEEKLPFPALVGRVIDYPEIELEVAGTAQTLLFGGGLNDLGGYNHIHGTGLKIRSGDVETRIELSGVVPTKKRELIALEVDRERGEVSLGKGRIFTGGIIYKYQ